MSIEQRMKARGELSRAIAAAFPNVDPADRITLGNAIEDLIDAKIETLPRVGPGPATNSLIT